MSSRVENKPIFPKPRVLNPTYQSHSANTTENKQASSSQIPSQNKAKFCNIIDIAELADIINSKGRDNVRASIWFQQHDEVVRAMGPNAWPRSNQPESKEPKRDELVTIGQEYFLIINGQFERILHFANRLDYISHFLSYYFSEKNLIKDTYMMDVLAKNDGVYPLTDLLRFPKLRTIEATALELCESAKNIDTISFDLRNGLAVFNALCPYVLNQLASNATRQMGEDKNQLNALPDPSLLPITYPNIQNFLDTPYPDGLTPQQFLQLFNFSAPLLTQGYVPAEATFVPYFLPPYYGFQPTNSPRMPLLGSLPQPPSLLPQHIVRPNAPRFQNFGNNHRLVRRD
ncbi:unnamed protein product [Hymenolepis diminuta]|uniref:HTH La-type RNA-binding domain-containing protein n=2 Tax=Hymenolepis diminuta TaxID=6216 RepID=A0A0R3SII6_HYMDI|nr:unnamed protein product [Hymenolepis diminuta]